MNQKVFREQYLGSFINEEPGMNRATIEKIVLLNKLVQRAMYTSQTKRYKDGIADAKILALLNHSIIEIKEVNEILDTEAGGWDS